MNPETTTATVYANDILAEVWRLKEENAAEHGYDIDAIAAAARENQKAHPKRIVRIGASGTKTDGPSNNDRARDASSDTD